MTVRVLTWNVWWRFPQEDRGTESPLWRRRQPAISQAIAQAQPDIVCLQEVYPATDRSEDQVERIADDLGFHHVTSFAAERPWMGNAILSRWPLDHVDVQPIQGSPGARSLRTAVHAMADAPDGPIPVTCTHLTWEYDQSATRVAQARAIFRRIGERRERHPHRFPPVLCGDLNATPDSDELRLLTGRSAVPRRGMVFVDAWAAASDDPGYTWHRENPHLAESTWPQRRLDYVLVAWPRSKPAGSVISAELVGVEAIDGIVPSDHYGVVVELATR